MGSGKSKGGQNEFTFTQCSPLPVDPRGTQVFIHPPQQKKKGCCGGGDKKNNQACPPAYGSMPYNRRGVSNGSCQCCCTGPVSRQPPMQTMNIPVPPPRYSLKVKCDFHSAFFFLSINSKNKCKLFVDELIFFIFRICTTYKVQRSTAIC